MPLGPLGTRPLRRTLVRFAIVRAPIFLPTPNVVVPRCRAVLEIATLPRIVLVPTTTGSPAEPHLGVPFLLSPRWVFIVVHVLPRAACSPFIRLRVRLVLSRRRLSVGPSGPEYVVGADTVVKPMAPQTPRGTQARATEGAASMKPPPRPNPGRTGVCGREGP